MRIINGNPGRIAFNEINKHMRTKKEQILSSKSKQQMSSSTKRGEKNYQQTKQPEQQTTKSSVLGNPYPK